MKLVKLFGVLYLLISLLACGKGNNKQVDVPEGWTSLSEDDYSINYPETWELNQSGQMGTSFLLFSQVSSEEDQFRENINLMIQDLKGLDIDLDKYVEISEGQVKRLITDGKINESKKVSTQDYEYQRIIYTGKQGIFNLKFEQNYYVIGEKAYVLTLTCEEDQFKDYKEIGEKILASFSIDVN